MSDDVEARKAAAELWGNELRRAIHASSATSGEKAAMQHALRQLREAMIPNKLRDA
jgi:hypothetical protein